MFTPSGKYVVKGGKNAQEVAKLFAADYHDLVGKTLTPKTVSYTHLVYQKK